MSDSWLIIFVGAFAAAVAGVFPSGGLGRKQKPPPGVKALTDEDDEKWK